MKDLKSVLVGLFASALVFGISACNTGAVRSDGTPEHQTHNRTETKSYPNHTYTADTKTYQSDNTYANTSSNTSYGVKGDNSKINERITKNSEWTAEDQGSSEHDLKTTQEIRKQVVDQDQFSSSAKNVKVITRDGWVVLKGPVKTMSEKNRIESIAKSVAGSAKVTNVITVTE
ncbi:MAG: BON domain-containing protein [Bdellovibrionaceae bacterium]|nr:BON domain-containing protein [Pseudobdellovibrionaceae bacterium]